MKLRRRVRNLRPAPGALSVTISRLVAADPASAARSVGSPRPTRPGGSQVRKIRSGRARVAAIAASSTKTIPWRPKREEKRDGSSSSSSRRLMSLMKIASSPGVRGLPAVSRVARSSAVSASMREKVSSRLVRSGAAPGRAMTRRSASLSPRASPRARYKALPWVESIASRISGKRMSRVSALEGPAWATEERSTAVAQATPIHLYLLMILPTPTPLAEGADTGERRFVSIEDHAVSHGLSMRDTARSEGEPDVPR